jgi:hypothetical protein
MPAFASTTTEAAPSGADVFVTPPDRRLPRLKPSGATLSGVYTTDTLVFAEADWVILQVALVAWQIHPATIAELAALGPLGGANAKRWTIEGPLSHRPGDPGSGNCTIKVEIATSMTDDPGSNWVEYEAGRYRLRSAKARLTVTRPAADYDWRVSRFALRAVRVPAGSRARRVAAGVVDAIPTGMSRVVVRDYRVQAGGTLRIEPDAYLKII